MTTLSEVLAIVDTNTSPGSVELDDTAQATTRVVVVDDHPLFLGGVRNTLGADPDIEVVGEGANADDALRLAQEVLPDVLLLDVSMPGGGLEAARLVATACPVIAIGMLTVSEHDDDVLTSLRVGARGYILKGIGGTELVNIVRGLHRGEMYVSPGLAAKILVESRTLEATSSDVESGSDKLIDTLTAREVQILELIAEGKSNREIGLVLHIAEKTVKNYVSNVFQKLQVRNRVEAAIFARQRH